MSATPSLAPNPHMWYFPKIQTVDGLAQVQIMRLDNAARAAFTAKYGTEKTMNPYIWASYFRNDVIILDDLNNSDIIEMSGDIDYSNVTEMLSLRAAKLQLTFNDKHGFSGTDM